MAYFRKRGTTWGFIIDMGHDTKTGKRKRTSKGGFKTKKEAQLAVAELQKELADGTYVKENNISFKNFANEWLNLYKESVKESSVRVRQHEIGCLNHYFENIQLKNITKRAYQNALIDLKKRGYSESTIAGIHGTGKMIFKKAMEFDILKSDPSQYAKPPKNVQTIAEIEQEKDIPKYLEKKELSLLSAFISKNCT